MIVRNRLSWRRIARYTGKEVAIFTTVALLVTLSFTQLHMQYFSIAASPMSIFGSALTIFLGFRTNSAYQRWWEARTLWGGVVNHCRSFARKALSYPDPGDKDPARQAEIEAFERDTVYATMAFAHALRCHLRKQDPFPEIAPFLPPALIESLRPEQNVPAALLLRIAQRLQTAHQRGLFDTLRFLSLSDSLTELTNLLGGCERIKNTTLPKQYDYFPRLFVWGFCGLLPLALVDDLKWWTVPICAVISFLFIALDVIGANIENPFENTIHDTPMSSLSRTIEINLRQMLGEKDLPPRVEPVDGYLY